MAMRFTGIYLKARTGKNTSHGTIEEMLSVYKLLTRAGSVQVLEVFPGRSGSLL